MSLWQVLVLVAGLGTLPLLWWLIHPPPRLRIGERGILDRGLGWGWIPWEEIEGAYPPTVKHGDSLRLRVRVTERMARVVRRRRCLDPGTPIEDRLELRLSLTGTGLSPIDVLEQIVAHRAGALQEGPQLGEESTRDA